MSTLTVRRPEANWLHTVLRAIENTVIGIAEGHEIYSRYRDLSRLSSAELARRGLTREQVPQAAVRASKGF